MWDLAKILRARRMRRGALDPGVKKAYQLIEELMLLANETIARTMVERNVPVVFRTHPPPDEAKLDRFAAMCEELGVGFDLEEAMAPKRLSAFLRKIEGHPKKQILHMLLLRAMKQAAYDVA